MIHPLRFASKLDSERVKPKFPGKNQDPHQFLAVNRYIFSTLVSQVAECSKSKGDHLIIERIKLTHRRDVEKGVPEKGNISLKRALCWNKTAKAVSKFSIMHIDPI